MSVVVESGATELTPGNSGRRWVNRRTASSGFSPRQRGGGLYGSTERLIAFASAVPRRTSSGPLSTRIHQGLARDDPDGRVAVVARVTTQHLAGKQCCRPDRGRRPLQRHPGRGGLSRADEGNPGQGEDRHLVVDTPRGGRSKRGLPPAERGDVAPDGRRRGDGTRTYRRKTPVRGRRRGIRDDRRWAVSVVCRCGRPVDGEDCARSCCS